MASFGGNWKDLLKGAGQGDASLTRYHLRQGVDPNFQHAEFFTCPIFEAIRNGHLDIVKILVEEGNADPNIIEEMTEQSPLEVALEESQYDIVDYLNTQLPEDQRWKRRFILVTDGTTEYGRAVCKLLLSRGHRVLFISHSETIGDMTVADLRAATKNQKVNYVFGKLTSVRKVQTVSKFISERFKAIDTLVHNASCWPMTKTPDEDGFETAFTVHYIAPLLLMRDLESQLRTSKSRIIFILPKLHSLGHANIARTPTGQDFSMFRSYFNTKCCTMFLFLNTARRFEGSSVQVTAVHNGGSIPPDLGQSTIWRHPRSVWRCVERMFAIVKANPLTAAEGVVQSALTDYQEDFHGKYLDFAEGTCSPLELVYDSQDVKDWDQWTLDFLAAHSRK